MLVKFQLRFATANLNVQEFTIKKPTNHYPQNSLVLNKGTVEGQKNAAYFNFECH